MKHINFNKLPIYILTGSMDEILTSFDNSPGLYYGVSTTIPNIKQRIIDMLDNSINNEGLAPAGLKRGMIGIINQPNFIGWSISDQDLLYSNGINPLKIMKIQYDLMLIVYGQSFIDLTGQREQVYGHDQYGYWINNEINPKFVDFVHHYNAVEDIMEPILPIPTTPIDPSWSLQYGLSITTPSTTNIKL